MLECISSKFKLYTFDFFSFIFRIKGDRVDFYDDLHKEENNV